MPYELVAENASLLEFDNVADQLQKVYRTHDDSSMALIRYRTIATKMIGVRGRNPYDRTDF
jgi:hypothetical protein